MGIVRPLAAAFLNRRKNGKLFKMDFPSFLLPSTVFYIR